MIIIKKHRTAEEKKTRLATIVESGKAFRVGDSSLDSVIAGISPLYVVAKYKKDTNETGIMIVSLDGQNVGKRDPQQIVISHEIIITKGDNGKNSELAKLGIGDAFIFPTIPGEEFSPNPGEWIKIAPIGPEKAHLTTVFSFKERVIYEKDSTLEVTLCELIIEVKEAEPAE